MFLDTELKTLHRMRMLARLMNAWYVNSQAKNRSTAPLSHVGAVTRVPLPI
ncbi:MAG: hypothetical protein LRZ87_02610 [Methanocellales archaeon]|nr:hypothetical protein [Methanocellales archaeon]